MTLRRNKIPEHKKEKQQSPTQAMNIQNRNQKRSNSTKERRPVSTKKKRLILHIGTEKTGSTSIQEFLKTNRKQLRKDGYIVPTTLGKDIHFKLQLMANSEHFVDSFWRNLGLSKNTKLRRKTIKQWRKEFEKEVKGSKGKNWIISCETLHSRLTTKEDIKRLRRILEPLFVKIDIIVYLRDPLDLVVSRLNENVKSALPIEIPLTSHKGFDICNHAETVKNWDGKLGPGELIPRLFTTDSVLNGNVVNDFCIVCNINRSTMQLPTKKNKSMPEYCLRIINEINRYVPRRWIDGTIIKSRWELIILIEKTLKTGEKIQANRKQIDHYKSYYEESNEWVRKKYFPQRKELFDCKQISQKSNAQVISQDQIEEIGRLIAMIWMRKNARINQLEAKTNAYKQIIKKNLRGKDKFETPRYHNKIENFFDC